MVKLVRFFVTGRDVFIRFFTPIKNLSIELTWTIVFVKSATISTFIYSSFHYDIILMKLKRLAIVSVNVNYNLQVSRLSYLKQRSSRTLI